MENNLNQEVIKKYSRDFSERVASAFFPSHDSIDNDNIMKVQDIRQVNLFVVKNLLDKWLKEAERLRSPYFDYSSGKVKEAMIALQNTLSRHIRIDRIDFMPLLIQSVEETLLLVFSPYDYYHHLFKDHDYSTISRDYLTRLEKYIKVNPHILQKIIERMEQESREELHRDDALQLLDDVVDKLDAQPADVEPFIEQFSSIAPLTTDMLYSNAAKEEPVSFIEAEKVEERKKEWKSLHDELMDEATSTLAEIHRHQKIHNIRKHLGINQRFMFISSLFGGSEDAFNSTIDHIENASGREEALEYLHSQYGNWDEQSEEVAEFMDIVERRHA